jgi:hypothetical protein
MPFAAKTVDRSISDPALEADVETTSYGTRGFARLVVLTIAKLVGEVWKSVPVSADDPVPTAARGYKTATAIVVGTNQTPGRAVHVTCSVAGDIKLRLTDDSEVVLTVGTGVTILPFEAKTVIAAGTTATATYLNLA